MSYWFQIPRAWRIWLVFVQRCSLIRVSFLSLILGVAIVAGAKLAVPALQLPPIWKMLLALPAVYAYMLLMVVVQMVVPSRVEVREDRILASAGQSAWFVKSEDIRRTRIVVFAPDRIRLRVFFSRRGKLSSRTFGLSPKLSLDDLCIKLAIYPEVWDARERYLGRQKAAGISQCKYPRHAGHCELWAMADGFIDP